ncbi:DUF3572 domain-containing protein [Flavimaricola marinus]|uniref:DUF3572 domain-containing protein n=1 Tax=Flavimaricola marinus TaxID=1819565 RepID=A0A238LGI2_9RHOB|nr:DUF3572 domain-containing protein [Flavimaricola marinus]SMY08751.1 hypothetical protein LOM8899_02907 [Flavimaricola marinus]
MTPNQAETVAIQALGWLASNDELWPVFLGSTGASAEDAAARAVDPAFLASVLEFLTMDDSWVMEFCDSVAVPYETPLRARYALPGAEKVEWT